MKTSFAVACLAASVCGAAMAEDTILVTASRTEDRGLSVIDRPAIDALQPVTALELLDRAAGVRAFSKGGAGGGSYLSVRGGEPNFTLVLLDGLKVNDPTNSQGGAFDFAQIDPAALDRIELARGARSSVHGADALAGVVNLRLREVGEGDRFSSGQASVDSEGAYGVGGTLGSGWAGGGLLLSANQYDSGDLTEGSDLERWQALGKVSQAIGAHSLSATVLHVETDRTIFPEDSGGPRFARVPDRERRDTSLTAMSVAFASGGEALRPSAALNWSRQDTTTASPAIPPQVPAIDADTRFERLEALLGLTGRLTSGLTFAVGSAYLKEDGRSTGTVDLGAPVPADFDVGRRMTSAYAEATYGNEAITASAGVRFDDPSSQRPEWTARAALRAGPIFASFADGYKLPSLYALHYPLIANPALRPERSRSFEGGLETDLGEGRIRIAYFRTRFRDLIDFDPVTFSNVNRARVETQGLEAEANQKVAAGWTLRGALTYLDVDSETPLRSRPAWQGSAAAEWQADGRLWLSGGARFNSDFVDSSVPTGTIAADGHVEIDLAARYALTQAATLQLTVRNLLSADYEDAVGFPAPGRVLRLTLGSRF